MNKYKSFRSWSKDLYNKLEILSPYYHHKSKKEVDLKILLVKQTVYQDLYCCNFNCSNLEKVISSLKRSGPVGLFTKFNTDFVIVETIEDEECQMWKQKVNFCNQGDLENYYNLEDYPYLDGKRGHLHGQKYYSKALDSINWNNYDIVISYDIAIPRKITQRYPGTLWCYYVSEPCMPAYKESQSRLIEGYDIFLNERFRKFEFNPRPKHHEIDFPYFIQYYGCFHELFKQEKKHSKRTGVFLETHTANLLSEGELFELKKFGPLRVTSGTIEEIIYGLLDSKYFVRLGGRRLWGNSMIEAIAAGCLTIGNPDEFKNISLFTPKTAIYSFDELIKRISFFENDSDYYAKELSKQRTALNYFCFDRPIGELINKFNDIALNRRD